MRCVFLVRIHIKDINEFLNKGCSGMAKSMILFDLDGTSLTSNGTMLTTTKNIIQLCKSKGYYIGFITARSRSKKNRRLLDSLPYDFIAFYNGAVIYVKNQLIESNSLPHQQAFTILQKLSRDYSDMVIDVNLEPWFFSSACNEIYRMDSVDRKKCNINNLPKYDVQRIRLRSEQVMCISLKKYMSYDSVFYHTSFGNAIIVHKKANKGYAAQKA